MKNKRTKFIILLIIILLLIAGTVIAICLLNKNDKPTTKDDGTIEAETETTTESTTEVTEEPTTETAASTEKPSEDEPEEPTTEAAVENKTGSTGSVDPAPAPKPEPAPSAPTEPAPSAPTTEAPTPAPKPEPAPSAPTTEAPKHEHSWVWVVDQAAWTEYKEHPAQYDNVDAVQCRFCGECFTTADAFKAHAKSFSGIDSNHSCAGQRSTVLMVLVKDAWTETIEHPEVGHWECSCGATK